MNKSMKYILVLSIATILLLSFMSVVTMNDHDGGEPYEFTSIRGEHVEIYGGNSMYRFDTVDKALLMTDFDKYFIGLIFVIVLGLYLFMRKSYVGYFILLSSNLFLGYNFIIASLDMAHNNFFLLYIMMVLLNISTCILLLRLVNYEHIEDNVAVKLKTNWIAYLTMFLASYFILRWVATDLSLLFDKGIHKDLAHYTTAGINVTDLMIYAPASILSGILLLRKQMVGLVACLGIIMMAAHTLIVLSITSFTEMSYFDLGIDSLRFPIITFAIICSVISVLSLIQMKGLNFEVE